MKKSITITILLLAAAIAFAQEESVQPEKKDRRFAVDLGLGYYYRTISSENYDVMQDSLAVNIAGSYLFTDYIGIGLNVNLAFPLKIINIHPQDQYTARHDDMTNRYYLPFIMDMLIGPVFYIYKNEKVSFPVSVGFHWLFWSWRAQDEERNLIFSEYINSNYIGVGANIAGRYNINDLISVYIKLKFAYDFYAFYKENSALMKTWNISPSLGISFRF